MSGPHRSRGRSRWSLPLGHLFGIEVEVHASFLLLVLLVVAASSGTAAGVGRGLVWLLAIFACVLAHELAHSVVARRRGATVRSILLPIGGVSRIDHMPEGWSDELVIAGIGPLASFGIAALCAAVGAVLGDRLWPPTLVVGSWASRLAWANVLLGAFNLLPAFPLDGGRVLRSVLERRRDLAAATRLAARVGRALGAAMVVVGLLWDLWLSIIGLMVVVGASAEEQATIAHLRLRGTPVARLMRTSVTTIDARRSCAEAGAVVAAWPCIVTDDGRYVGLVDRRSRDAAPPSCPLGEVADVDAATLTSGEDVGREALDAVLGSGYDALAVVDGGRVVGVLRVVDVERWLESGSAHR